MRQKTTSSPSFLPILLGTDNNAYGMARSFHEAYGIKSLALGKIPLLETRNSSIVSVTTLRDFDTSPVFLHTLDKVYESCKTTYDHLLLIACGDRYVDLVTQHKESLEKNFIVPYIDKTLQEKLEHKADFYAMCERYKLPYPDTMMVTLETRHSYPQPPSFPVAVKASDSISYVDLDFSGKMKSYKARSPKDLDRIIQAIFDAGYRDTIIVQDFIPGDDAAMYVLNSYSDQEGQVRAMCLGQCVLEDYTPDGIGNYNAIIQKGISDIYATYRVFLEAIGFVGFSNFDIKYDCRDGKYKVFEMNIRQGRSSFFTTASGCNLAEYLVDDRVFHKPNYATHYHDRPFLWRHVPRQTLMTYAPAQVQEDIVRLYRSGRDATTLIYDKDRSPKRLANLVRIYGRQALRTKKYYPK